MAAKTCAVLGVGGGQKKGGAASLHSGSGVVKMTLWLKVDVGVKVRAAETGT